MRIVFAGSPEAAVPSLKMLREAGYDVVGVLSQPDRPVGRKRVITPTAVSAYALTEGLTLITPGPSDRLTPVIEMFQPDLAIAVAYGRLIDRDSLLVPAHGWWNLHFSLLPALRGAAPVQRALLAGATMTGVSVFQMDEGLDTGPLLLSQECPIPPGITAGELLQLLAKEGAEALLHTLSEWRAGVLKPRVQEGLSSLAPKLSREEGRLRCGESASANFVRYQACTPEPGAFFRVKGADASVGVRKARLAPEKSTVAPGEVAEVSGEVHVGCIEGALILERVVSSGSREMPASDWLRGAGRGVSFEL